MTIVYREYELAYNDKTLDLDNVDFHVNLVSEDYDPRRGHKKNDVKDFIICSLQSLDGNIINRKSMSEIIDKIKDKAEKWIPNHIEDIRVDVDKVFALKPAKAEKIKELIRQTDFETNKRDYWENLAKHGIKWFVIEDKRAGRNLLCFCEPIDKE